jgi:hypothetical protein
LLNAIAATGDKRALPVIIQFMSLRTDNAVRSAFEALTAIGNGDLEWLPDVLALANQDALRCVFWHMNDRGEQGFQALAEALEHDNPVVRTNARWLLALRGREDVYLHDPLPIERALPAVSDFGRFLEELEVTAPPERGANQSKTSIRFRGREYVSEGDEPRFVMFAVVDEEIIIHQTYLLWQSDRERTALTLALEWLPRNAFIVLTGYGLDQSLKSEIDRGAWTDAGHISYVFREWGGAATRIDRLTPKTAYILIAAHSTVGAKPVEITSAGAPAVYPARPQMTPPQAETSLPETKSSKRMQVDQ